MLKDNSIKVKGKYQCPMKTYIKCEHRNQETNECEKQGFGICFIDSNQIKGEDYEGKN
jgi:hypothetical protein